MRVVLVDDEPLALRRLRTMLSEHSDVEIVAECEDAGAALNAVRRERPNVVFLDVQMPEVNGFQMLGALDVTPAPFIVFVTAYAEHAVRAFDADAVDYVLKPFDRARLGRSLDRARAALAAATSEVAGPEVRELVRTLRGAPPYVTRLTATVGRRTFFVKTEDIDWIRADRNYLELHVGPHQYLVRSSIGGLEQQLDPQRFTRIHRSMIVNVDRVRELRMVAPGDYHVLLADGTELPVSAAYRDRLRRP
jgi:two-component system LytT family response regulator